MKSDKWIPITERLATEEEKKAGYDCTYIIDSHLPDDGDVVLVSTVYGDVQIDTFCWDEDGKYFEKNKSNVVAWMPLSEAY